MHRRQDCSKADLWPKAEVLSEEEDLGEEHAQRRECLERPRVSGPPPPLAPPARGPSRARSGRPVAHPAA